MANLTPNQRRVLEYIRKYDGTHGYAPTLGEIATHMGILISTTQQYIAALEQKGVISRTRYQHRSIQVMEELEDIASSRFDLRYVGNIAAGEPIEAIETPEEIDLQSACGLRTGDEHFVLMVRGDSMVEDGIFDGDFVIVQRTSTARDGQAVVALLEDGNATLKRFYRERNRIRLEPANSSMAPLYVPDVTIQGVVRGVIRPVLET